MNRLRHTYSVLADRTADATEQAAGSIIWVAAAVALISAQVLVAATVSPATKVLRSSASLARGGRKAK